MKPKPSTNVLIALKNILSRKKSTLPTVINHINSNRINSAGDLLEYLVKDAFCGTSMDLVNSEEKLREYQKRFSYLGNSNNPPDFIVRHGVAVEVKKIENRTFNSIALNSSFPKDYLYSSDVRINKACRQCEDEFGGWDIKEMIYAVGNVSADKIHTLWFVYGDCFCADKSTYERVAKTIKDGVSAIPGVEFADTKELGRVNRVDPLGITYLRIRGMWGIEHPSAVFKSIANYDPNKTNVYVLMKKETHEKMEEKPNFQEYIDNGILKCEDVKILDPNNPAKNLDAVLYTAFL